MNWPPKNKNYNQLRLQTDATYLRTALLGRPVIHKPAGFSGTTQDLIENHCYVMHPLATWQPDDWGIETELSAVSFNFVLRGIKSDFYNDPITIKRNLSTPN